MKQKFLWAMVAIAVGMLFPDVATAQSSVAGEIKSLQTVLDNLYEEMIPMCRDLITVGKGIAGFGATWFIGSRIWRHIANAEPIDFYPLFRPFVLGFAIINFNLVVDLIRGVMKPTVTATNSIVKNTDEAVATLLKMKEEAVKQSEAWQMYVGPSGGGDYDKWYKYYHGEEVETWWEGIENSVKFALAKASYNFRNSVKEWMSVVLQILFQAAALCINTIRTFYLVVLSILGPLVFGLAVFDGFQHSLTVWLARYINVFLWLPIANIFGAIIGKIQVNMLKIDLSQIAQQGDTFFSATDAGYIVFMLIGIVGYFTVPGVANYVIHAGGGNALLYKATSMSVMAASSTARTASNASGSMVSDVYGDARGMLGGGYQAKGGDYFKDKLSGK
jgi:conjugative transposon TraJ protein